MTKKRINITILPVTAIIIVGILVFPTIYDYLCKTRRYDG